MRRGAFRRLIGAAVILVALAAVIGITTWMEKSEEKPEIRGDVNLRYEYEDTVEIDGVTYRLRRNLTTILLMGIDRDSTERIVGYRNGGAADFMRLVVIDHDNKTIEQIAIDRDTMTPITILGVMGNKSGKRSMQISLSHGFGDGKEQSCEFSVEAVSNLMFGINIDFYIAMNLDGIPALNDAVGGVTVRIEDDLTSLDPALSQGATVTLLGDQAEAFVRSRMTVSDGTNVSRMRRQQQYLSKLTTKLMSSVSESGEFAGKLYDTITAFTTTNISRGRLVNEVYSARDYAQPAVLEIQGEHLIGSDGYMQFYADEQALKQMVIDIFYIDINS